MSDNSELIERTLNTSQLCLLPQFQHEFDTKPLSSSDFEQYKLIANENIYLLLDILYQNRYLLCNKVYDNQVLEICINLLFITCEQIEPNEYFHSDDKILLDSLWKITSDHIQTFEDKIYQQMIQRYKKSLTKNEWKRNFGVVHGFPLFCKIMLQYKSELIDEDFMMFMLSVGSNLVSHYEPFCKTIGLKIYMHMLQLGSHDKIKELNIQQVIYSEINPLIQRSNEMNYNVHLYEALYSIIKMDSQETNKWTSYDDVMSKLLTHFGFESDPKLSKFLIYQISKFCAINFDFKSFEEIQSLDEQYLEDMRAKFTTAKVRVTRWTRKLMETMTRESVRLLNVTDDAQFHLYIFNILYIVTIQSHKPSDFQQTLEDFTTKIILILMRVVKKHKSDEKIVKLVLFMLSTIEGHQVECEGLRDVIQKIRCHEAFK